VDTIKGCSVIDLFCGVGGLTHGFVKEGFKVVAGVDCDKACRYAYETNNNGARFIDKTIEAVTPDEVHRLYPRTHTQVLVGCAPCQPFSSYAKKKRQQNDKWKLLQTFANLVEQVQPHVVSMENVPALIHFNGGSVYREFVNCLKKNGYHVTDYVVHCAAYGIPQSRDRLVLFASKHGPIDMIDVTHKPGQYISVRDAISHLSPIEAGGICPDDPLHRASNLAEINLKRIRQSVPGGTWRDWEEELVADCHKKTTGASYDSVYGRMRWNDPAPTMTTQCNGFGNGRFGHPEQDRAISMREAAIFQSFPQDYQFLDPDTKWHVETLARLIGNAVPVKLGQAIASSIKQHIGK
jgi:DNA (cytosine-5)-methyltransferase 1